MLTICYVTGRLEPHFEWFADSLHRETGGDYDRTRIVVVDYWAAQNGDRELLVDPVERASYFAMRARWPLSIMLHVPPKPTVWQGRHRLSRTNYFCAANARNTGLCLAEDGAIAYADDLAVLAPGWLSVVRRSASEGFCALGAYRKVVGLKVDRDGAILSPSDPYDVTDRRGVDSRWDHGRRGMLSPASGSWMYGCSVAMPIEALLAANGWDERADARGLGSEDYLTGMVVERSGCSFRYCLDMLTLEEDGPAAHATPFVREIARDARDPARPDASHVLLSMVRDTDARVAPNYFPEGGVRGVRAAALRGEPFPPATVPEHCWYTGTPIREL